MLPISRRIKDKVHQEGRGDSATLAMASRAQGTLALKRVLPLLYNLDLGAFTHRPIYVLSLQFC